MTPETLPTDRGRIDYDWRLISHISTCFPRVAVVLEVVRWVVLFQLGLRRHGVEIGFALAAMPMKPPVVRSGHGKAHHGPVVLAGLHAILFAFP